MESKIPAPPRSLALRVAVARMAPVAMRRPWRHGSVVFLLPAIGIVAALTGARRLMGR